MVSTNNPLWWGAKADITALLNIGVLDAISTWGAIDFWNTSDLLMVANEADKTNCIFKKKSMVL